MVNAFTTDTPVFLILATIQYKRICARAKLQTEHLIHLRPKITVSRQCNISGRSQHLKQ